MESEEKGQDEIKELRKKNEAEFRVFLETDSIPGDSAFGNASHLFPHSQIAKSSIKSEIKTQIQMLPFPSDILSNIPEFFTQGEEYHQALIYEFGLLEIPFSIFKITERCESLNNINKILTCQLSFNLTKHSPEIIDGIHKINYIEKDLQFLHCHTSTANEKVKEMKKVVINTHLRILDKRRKKKALIEFKQFIKKILCRFKMANEQIQDNLQRGFFYQAFVLLKKNLTELKQFLKHDKNHCFLALSQLKMKLEKQFTNLNSLVNGRLISMCTRYNPFEYEDICKISFHQFKNSPSADSLPLFNHLHDQFKKEIKSICMTTMKKYLSTSFQLLANKMDLQFERICKLIDDKEDFLECLNDIYKAMTQLLYYHHLITRYHDSAITQIEEKSSKENINLENIIEKSECKNETEGDEMKGKQNLSFSETGIELEFHKRMKNKMLEKRKELWILEQKKIVKVLLNTNELFGKLAIGEVFEFLVLSNKFIQIGQDFSLSQAQHLLEAIKKTVCKSYFQQFDKMQFNNLKLFIEEDLWCRLPLPDHYVIPEFQKLMADYPRNMDELLCVFCEKQEDQNYAERARAFSNFAYGNPFQMSYKIFTMSHSLKAKKLKERNTSFSEEDFLETEEKEANERIFIQETKIIEKKKESKNTVISSSGLTLIKCMSKYMELFHILKPIAFDIFISLTHLFEFYLFIVFILFANENQKLTLLNDSIFAQLQMSDVPEISSLANFFQLYLFHKKYKDLRAHLLTIKDFLESNFPIDIKESGKMSLLNHTIQKNISIIPQLNSGVNLEDTSTMKGLPQKIVAVESVFFIHDALFSLKSQLEDSMHKKHGEYVNLFFCTSSILIRQLRDFIYSSHSFNFLKMDSINHLIYVTNWNLKDQRKTPNDYLDRIIHQLRECEEKLEYLGGGSIPKYVQLIFFQYVIRFICQQLTDAYSKVKKCNETGRIQMKNDLNFLKKYVSETLCIKKDLDSIYLVESFLHCFSLEVPDLFQWIYTNLNYPINCINSMLMNHSHFSNLKKNEKRDYQIQMESYFQKFLENYSLTHS